MKLSQLTEELQDWMNTRVCLSVCLDGEYYELKGVRPGRAGLVLDAGPKK